jgi:Protein of unknown function (DUF3592)
VFSTRDPLAWAALARDAIGIAVAAGAAITLWLRKRSARNWPTVSGKVEQASCFENNGTWITDISYSYTVAGEFFSGQFPLKARNEQKANEQIVQWKDQSILVRYSPRKPEISAVRIEDQAALHPGEFRGH